MSTIKQLIKELADGQKSLKQDRKTGTLPEFPRDEWGYANPWAIPQVKKALNAAAQVQRNKVRITAALNVYHEMRGTGFSHNCNPDRNPYAFKYAKDYEELKTEFMSQGDDR